MGNYISGKQAVLWSITLSLLLVIYGYFQLIIVPRKIEHTAALKKVVPMDVEKMKVVPTGQLCSVEFETPVADAHTIERIVGLISDSSPFRPSHPISRWECRLEIETDSDSWSIKLVDSERHGVLAYVESGLILTSAELHEIRDLIEPSATTLPNKTAHSTQIPSRVD